MRVDYRTYMASDQWKRVRMSALQRARRCEICGRYGLPLKNRERYQVDGTNGLQVHHLHYRTLGNEQPEDLIVLCTDTCFLDEYRRLPPLPSGVYPFPDRVGCHERCHDDPTYKAMVRRIADERPNNTTHIMTRTGWVKRDAPT